MPEHPHPRQLLLIRLICFLSAEKETRRCTVQEIEGDAHGFLQSRGLFLRRSPQAAGGCEEDTGEGRDLPREDRRSVSAHFSAALHFGAADSRGQQADGLPPAPAASPAPRDPTDGLPVREGCASEDFAGMTRAPDRRTREEPGVLCCPLPTPLAEEAKVPQCCRVKSGLTSADDTGLEPVPS